MTHKAESTDLCTLADLKSFLFRGGSSNVSNADDDLLQRLIGMASTWLRGEVGKNFVTANYTEKRSGVGWGQSKLFVKHTPINSVSSLYINGNAVPAISSNATDYNSANGYGFSDDFIYLLGGYEFSKDKMNIQVTYNAGNNTIPADIEGACIEAAAKTYREIDRLGYQSKTLAGETITFDLKALSERSQIAINAYKRVVPI